MPVIAVTIVDQTVGVTQVGEIGLTGPTGPTGTVSAAGDGTAAAPGIAFASDTNTGIYRIGSDILGIATGGVENVRAYVGGFGIGTGASTDSALHVQAPGNIAGMRIGFNGTSNNFFDGDTQFFRSGDGVTVRVRITSTGNVGIGTTSPATRLTVSAAAGYIANFTDGTRDLRFYTASGFASLVSERVGDDLQLGVDGLASRGLIIKTSNGNVGIGTTDPTTLLTVGAQGDSANTNSTLRVRGRSVSDGSGTYGSYGEILLNATAGYTGSARRFLLTNALSANKFAIIRSTDAATDPTLGTAGAITSGTADFVIDNTGNVGIGTISPGEKLQVSGNIKLSAATNVLAFGNPSYPLYVGDGSGLLFAPNNNEQYAVLRGYAGVALATSGNVGLFLNSSGNVGIGTTSPNKASKDRALTISGSSNAILEFAQGDVLKGYIYNDASVFQVDAGPTARMAFVVNSLERVAIETSGHVTPGADNTQNLGSGSLRWATIYAGTGTINTSDERYKVLREGGDLTDAEFAAWSNVRAIVYQDKDSFERKGSAARLHVGYSWQSIQAAFKAEGLDAARYGLWCEDALEAPVEKTRMVSRPVEGQTETVPVLDDDGQPVFEQVQETEEVEQPFEEVRMIDGAPVLVKGVRTVAQPVFDSVQIMDEDGELIFDTPQPIEDPETGELVEGDPIPRMAPVPRMIRKAKTETVPVMEEVEETYTEMEPTGETRGALRYNQCSVIEAAWLRRELASVVARLSALEAA